MLPHTILHKNFHHTRINKFSGKILSWWKSLFRFFHNNLTVVSLRKEWLTNILQSIRQNLVLKYRLWPLWASHGLPMLEKTAAQPSYLWAMNTEGGCTVWKKEKKKEKKYRLWGQDVWAKSWILCICSLWPLQACSSPATCTHENCFTAVSLDFQDNFLRVNFGAEIGSTWKIWLESTQKKAWAKPPSLETWDWLSWESGQSMRLESAPQSAPRWWAREAVLAPNHPE